MRLNIHLHSNASMFVYGLINTVETVFSAKLGPGSLRHSFVTTGGNKLKGASRSKSCVSIDCARPILLRVPGQGEGCSGLPRWRGARTIHPSRQSRGSGGGRRIIPPHTHTFLRRDPSPQRAAGTRRQRLRRPGSLSLPPRRRATPQLRRRQRRRPLGGACAPFPALAPRPLPALALSCATSLRKKPPCRTRQIRHNPPPG